MTRNQVLGTLSEPLNHAMTEASPHPRTLSYTTQYALSGLERVGSDFLSFACERVLLDPKVLRIIPASSHHTLLAYEGLYTNLFLSSHLAISVFLECSPSFPSSLTQIISNL